MMQSKVDEHLGTGVSFVLMATLGWSLSGLFVRFLPGLTGWQINCWRGYWMAAALLCYLVLTYQHELPARIRAIPRAALWTSALCFAAGTTLYVTSLTLTSTATVSVIGAMSPLVTGLLSPWITGEKPSFLTWFAAAMALAGAGVIGWNGLQTGHVAGIITSFGVPFTFAVQTLLLRRYRHIDLMPAICLGGFLSFIGAGVLGFTAGTPGGGFGVSLRELGILMAMGPLQLAIPLILYGKGARHVPAVSLALLSMLDAILNPLWPWLFAGEVPERAALTGGAIILGAVLLGILGGRIYDYARRASTR